MTMIAFETAIDNLVTNIQLMETDGYLKDQNLPFNLRQDWVKKELERKDKATILNPYQPPTFDDIQKWLKPQQ